MNVSMWRLDWMGFGIDDLKVCIRIFVVFVYQHSLPQLFEGEERDSDTCNWGNVL